MAGTDSKGASSIRQRIAGFLQRRTTWPPFIDPRTHSWARAVKSRSELPAQYRPYFDGIGAGADEPLPYAVLTPTFRGAYGHPEPERLLCILDGAVHVVETAQDHLECSSFSPDGLQMIEYGVLLLHSWMTIRGWDAGGAMRSVTTRFNSVSDYLMAPFVDCLRGEVQAAPTPALETERARLDYLAASHYKFRTYGRACLRPGDMVRHIIFQPEMRRERIRVLGKSFTRLLSPAHLCILTNRELIEIRDDPGQRWARGSPHGAIWTYIPRNKIVAASLAPRADGTQELLVDLKGGLCIRSLFDPDKAPELEATIAALGR